MLQELAPTDPIDDSRTKAAIIVRLLRSVDAELSLSALPARAQVALARAIGTMGPVDRDMVNATVEEFASAVDRIALPSTGGVSAALRALDGHISPDVAAQVAEEHALNDPNHAWVRLSRLTDEDLLRVMEGESIQIAALLISKLPVDQSARLLSLMPGDRARRIAISTPALDTMNSTAVHDIARALVQDYCAAKPNNFDTDAVGRVGAILNSTGSERRNEVLDGLNQDNPEFAARVREAIFTFENIPERIEPLDIPKVIRVLDTAQLTLALGGALNGAPGEAKAAEFVLENMSKRMASQIREDIAADPAPRRGDVEEMHRLLIESIRGAIETGEITQVPQE